MQELACTAKSKEGNCIMQTWALTLEDEEICSNCRKREPLYEERRHLRGVMYRAKAQMLRAYKGGRA